MHNNFLLGLRFPAGTFWKIINLAPRKEFSFLILFAVRAVSFIRTFLLISLAKGSRICDSLFRAYPRNGGTRNDDI